MTEHSEPICRPVVFTLVVTLVLLIGIGCGDAPASQYQPAADSNGAQQVTVTRPALSDSAQADEELFNANCSLCHGVYAAGTRQGPPLVNKVYKPGHHSDFSIRTAVRQGVRQHHWSFGDMPPIAGISVDEVEKIICYVRELQRANDIFEGDTPLSAC